MEMGRRRGLGKLHQRCIGRIFRSRRWHRAAIDARSIAERRVARPSQSGLEQRAGSLGEIFIVGRLCQTPRRPPRRPPYNLSANKTKTWEEKNEHRRSSEESSGTNPQAGLEGSARYALRQRHRERRGANDGWKFARNARDRRRAW